MLVPSLFTESQGVVAGVNWHFIIEHVIYMGFLLSC